MHCMAPKLGFAARGPSGRLQGLQVKGFLKSAAQPSSVYCGRERLLSWHSYQTYRLQTKICTVSFEEFYARGR
jgi:hypothetical protein